MERELIEVRIFTSCVGWEDCECNRCKIARLSLRNKIEDKELILQMFNKILEVKD